MSFSKWQKAEGRQKEIQMVGDTRIEWGGGGVGWGRHQEPVVKGILHCIVSVKIFIGLVFSSLRRALEISPPPLLPSH